MTGSNLLKRFNYDVAIMVAMLAQQYGGDFEQGARVVSLSTLLCLVSVPLMLILAQLIW